MIAFRERLRACREHAASRCTPLPAPYPAYVFFFSATDGHQRAHVVHACGPDFTTAWQRGVEQLQQWIDTQEPGALWLRVDWVEGARAVSWERFENQLALTKRNYFRYGLAFDEDFDCAFTEQELNANAMLYGGADIEHAVVNRGNFAIYHRARFGLAPMPGLPPAGPVYLLSTRGVFCQTDGVPHALEGTGLSAGRRVVDRLDTDRVMALVRSGSSFLAQQVQSTGTFVYGHFPCFDRRIPTYNTLRHASSVYAMLEAWELTRDPTLKNAIDRAIEHVAQVLVRSYTLPSGLEVAFLIDTADEIKLGGNAVCLLAIVKYCELMDSDRWLPLLEKLALGIACLQDAQTGRFNHVLNAGDLSLKQATRVIYYDGEAAFGLMRLYALTRDERWLAVVEKAFGYFIANEHWRAHDHWLSYCVNELTRWRPKEAYFRFGLLNVSDHLDFVLERKTTFPTLLELMLAAEQMLRRLRTTPAMQHLLEDFDIAKFYRALEHRANYMLNGFFWPELAMYFKKPSAIQGSFFIRHQAFRVRIDDVEHYLSGFVAYHRFLLQTPVDEPAPALLKQDLSKVTM